MNKVSTSEFFSKESQFMEVMTIAISCGESERYPRFRKTVSLYLLVTVRLEYYFDFFLLLFSIRRC